ncbi:YggN family protein [Shewanella sp. 1_MG-2023]|uniref:YggN family protein n=1 Tax=unclassified Shewanella TaxID=196818 RepID=UPI0026E13456|nr:MULTISPECIES: YggN family protein [unclassified Shewanella]MDO6610088.1 YggN family protein [Shewanella sp. 7_MG-2023]MDO6769770.1 YggN family protein [Shewanella sp. 2_MG-2023]MDO6792834.1 YggN family protein [Shewanella sp. 1_MG-2023]
MKTQTNFTNGLIKGLALSGLIFTAGAITPAMAKLSLDDEQCNVTLNYDVTVEPKKLLISEKGEELYRVEMGELYVEGSKIDLDSKQRNLLTNYSEELSQQVPEIIDLVNEVVVLATDAVSLALTPIFGDATGAKLDELLAGIQTRIDEAAYQQGDKFYLGATESSIEEAFNEDFEQEMEAMIKNSMGSFMMALGAEMMSSEGGSFEEKMEAFSTKMERVGEDIELQIADQSEAIEAKAEKICADFEELMALESEVRQSIPELASYQLATLDNTQYE